MLRKASIIFGAAVALTGIGAVIAPIAAQAQGVWFGIGNPVEGHSYWRNHHRYY